MITLKNNISINKPIEKVFGFIANPENLPKWNYYLKTVHKIADGNPVIGSQYHQVRKKDEQYFAITGFEENRSIEFTSTKSSFLKFKRQFTFSIFEGVCMIDDIFEISTGLPVPAFINKLLGKKPQMAVKENLLKLKQLLETGQTILQDGRLISL